MAPLAKQSKRRVPDHWIGVEADWLRRNLHPAQCLVSCPPSDMQWHMLCLGETGCGKTNFFYHLIAQDILLGHSFAVLDMNGDLVQTALELCAGRVEPELLKILDLREKNRPMGYDPLAGAGEPYFHALNVLRVVEAESDYHGSRLAETMRYAFIALSEAREPLTKLEAIFYDPGFRNLLLGKVESEEVAGYWRRYGALSSSQQQVLAGPVLNKVSLLLATKNLRKILGHRNPIDLGRHLDTPGSVLLVSQATDELHAAGSMFGALVRGSICREILSRVRTPEDFRNPVRLYVDEFSTFDSTDFESILALGRRFKISLVIAHQTLSQLSPKMRSLVLGNVGVKCIFRCGRDDSETLSKDLTGSKDAIDFTKLRRGQAVLWRRNAGMVGVEINAPICKGGGRLSPDAQALLDGAYAFAGANESSNEREPIFAPKGGEDFAQGLEDWL